MIDVGARAGRNFAAERAEPGANVFEAVTKHVQALQAAGKRVVDRAVERGRARAHEPRAGRPRACTISRRVGSWPQALALPKPQVALAVLGLESGFETADVAVISEQDILGDRLVRPRRAAQARRRISSPRRPASSAGDLVVHVDHGIGRFVGLKTIEAAGAPHDCLEIHYAGGAKLYPAGREHRAAVALRLARRPASSSTGSAAAAGRRARRGMKNRIREIADELIKVAAERQTARGAAARRRARALRRVLRRLPLRGDRRPAGRDRRHASTISPPAGRWTG